jgi:hypothetical protein
MFGISATAIAATSLAVTAVGTGVSMYGASQQASAQRKAGKQAAISGGMAQAQSEYEAKNIIEQSQEQARLIRQKALMARGTQVATAASSGVLVGDGSTQTMVDEVSRLAEQDAVAVLWSGAAGYISKNEEGRLASQNGLFQSQQANAAARTTLISGFGNAMSSTANMGLTLASMKKG